MAGYPNQNNNYENVPGSWAFNIPNTFVPPKKYSFDNIFPGKLDQGTDRKYRDAVLSYRQNNPQHYAAKDPLENVWYYTGPMQFGAIQAACMAMKVEQREISNDMFRNLALLEDQVRKNQGDNYFAEYARWRGTLAPYNLGNWIFNWEFFLSWQTNEMAGLVGAARGHTHEETIHNIENHINKEKDFDSKFAKMYGTFNMGIKRDLQ
ncbi:hypothetical protein B0J14DRAFT_57339 [Halenospora varia]|nr:hypothetical protein B0J14DRAFT_57339 [Halenospora varia]